MYIQSTPGYTGERVGEFPEVLFCGKFPELSGNFPQALEVLNIDNIKSDPMPHCCVTVRECDAAENSL